MSEAPPYKRGEFILIRRGTPFWMAHPARTRRREEMRSWAAKPSDHSRKKGYKVRVSHVWRPPFCRVGEELDWWVGWRSGSYINFLVRVNEVAADDEGEVWFRWTGEGSRVLWCSVSAAEPIGGDLESLAGLEES